MPSEVDTSLEEVDRNCHGKSVEVPSSPGMKKTQSVPSSPLRTSSPLVEIRKMNHLSLVGSGPLSRSRSNSHTSMSNDSQNSDDLKISTDLSVISLNLDDNCIFSTEDLTSETIVVASSRKTPPPSPLPPYLRPHSQGSSTGPKSKINKGPYSPTKRQAPVSSSSQKSGLGNKQLSNSSIATSSTASTTSPTKKLLPSKTDKKTVQASTSTFSNPVDIKSPVNAVCIVPAGSDETDIRALVLSASADGMVRLISAVSGQVQRTFDGVPDRALCVAVSTSLPCRPGEECKVELGGPRIVAAGSRGGLCIWDFHTGANLHTIESDITVWGVTIISPSTDLIDTVSDDNSTEDELPYAVVLGACSDGQVHAWRADTGEVIKSYEVHEDSVLCIASYADLTSSEPTTKSVVVTGGADYLVHVWEYPSGNVHDILSGHSDDVTCVSIVVDEVNKMRVVSGSRDRSVRVWDVKTGNCLAELTGHTDTICGVGGVVWNFYPAVVPFGDVPEERTSGSTVGNTDVSNSSIEDADVESGAANEVENKPIPKRRRSLTNQSHLPLARSEEEEDPATLVVVSCAADSTVCVWNVYQHKLITTSKSHKDVVKGIALGQVIVKSSQRMSSAILLASCSWDRNIVFYKLESLLKGKGGDNCRCTIS